MPQFRKKALVFAEQYIPGMPLPEGVVMHGEAAILLTLEGPHVLRSGDWVVLNPGGERYNVAAQEFADTYEEVTTVTHGDSSAARIGSEAAWDAKLAGLKD